jgi:predicted O-methyltransferase YrrM
VDAGFWAVHEGLEHQGPGSADSTRRTLSLVPELADGPAVVLDLGCGAGRQTLVLAAALPRARIVAVDLHPPFVEEVRRRADAAGVGDRVEAVVGDAADVDALSRWAPADAVWSEGAAWALGFEAALTAWRPLLRDRGVLVVTEPVWTAVATSRAVLDFWAAAYPDLQTAQVRRAQLLRAGYQRVGDLLLTAEDWAAYHGPLRARVAALRAAPSPPPGVPAVALEAALAATEHELAVHDGGGADAVGYCAFVARRRD